MYVFIFSISTIQYSMRLNLRPPSDYYQASTKDFAYSIILFILGLICLVPVVYAIIRYSSDMYNTCHNLLAYIYRSMYFSLLRNNIIMLNDF